MMMPIGDIDLESCGVLWGYILFRLLNVGYDGVMQMACKRTNSGMRAVGM